MNPGSGNLAKYFPSKLVGEEAFEGEYFLYVQSWYIVTISGEQSADSPGQSVSIITGSRGLMTSRTLGGMKWCRMFLIQSTSSSHGRRNIVIMGMHATFFLSKIEHLDRQLVSLLLFWPGYTNDGIIQGAFSMPRHIRKQDVIDTLEIAPFCDDRRCTVYHDRDIVHLVVATEVNSGFSLRVHVEPRNHQLPCLPDGTSEEPPGYFDDLVLMQHSSHVHPQVPHGHW